MRLSTFAFKYTNFFFANMDIISKKLFNKQLPIHLQIMLPVGISFYIFQALSYLIDVYRKKVCVQKNFIHLLLYVSLFPQLVAGPIVRYETIENEISQRNINIDSIFDGACRFILGLFKKVCFANLYGVSVDKIFAIPFENLTLNLSWSGLLLYTLQIYFDFSAYSDMAIGLGKIFGFHFNENFDMPYTAKNVTEFWRRWHVSLSSFFRDYLYIPLGGNRKGVWVTYLNTIIVFLVSGLWHGASWTFVVWGLINGIFLVVNKFVKWNPVGFFSKLLGVVTTFSIWTISLSFFRSRSIPDAWFVLANIGFDSQERLYEFGLNSLEFGFAVKTLVLIVFFELIIERKKEILYKVLNSIPIRWLVYVLLPLSIVYLGVYGSSDNSFIYFQF